MKYTRKFDTVSAYESAELDYPNMSYIVEDDSIRLAKTAPPPPHDYSQDYLTLEALESGTFSYEFNDDTWFYYSTDGGENWNMYDIGSSPISVSSGDTVMFFGALTPNYGYGVGTFSSTGKLNAMGNPMSLLYGDNFTGQTSLSGKDYAFYNLFKGCTNLVDAKNLSLPATTLSIFCYFCMFEGCTSLTTAPTLPATTLATYCYGQMFNGCTSLTTAPTLPATTLADGCYSYMFNGCTSLNSITCLATDISASACTTNWVNGVSANGTFIKNPSMTSWTSGSNGIPSNWTVQDAS